MNCKKKRGKGVRVKKYQHGGYHGDPPYTASADGTYVAMPDLSFLPVLQPLPEEPQVRQTGMAFSQAPYKTPEQRAADDRKTAAWKRRIEAIERGINPNLAFTMPPGIMGDPQAAAEYQYDNMLTSPIGQVATALAFTPIDIGIEAALPFMPSTYAGRQLNRFGEYVSTKAGQFGDNVVQRFSEPAPLSPSAQPLDGAVNQDALAALNQSQGGFATESRIGEGLRVAEDVYDRRMSEYFSAEGQRRMREKIADDLTALLNAARRQKVMGSEARQALQRLEGAVINGRVNPNSALVSQELQYANSQVRSSTKKLQRAGSVTGAGIPESELMALDAEYMALKESGKRNAQRYNDLINEVEQLERAGQWDLAKQKSKELDALEPIMKQEFARSKEIVGILNQETGGLLESTAQHSFGGNEIEIGGAHFLDPLNASRVMAHEFQHLLQRPGAAVIDQATGRLKGALGTARRNYGVRSEGILKIEQDLGQLMKYRLPTSNLDDLRYFETAGMRGDILERSAFVAELREYMVQKGAMGGSYDFVTPGMIDDFVKNQTKKGDLRIVDLFDFNKPEVRKIVADAMNKLPVVAAGVGAAGAAAGGTQDFKYGGKIKIKKKRKSGYRTV